MADPPPTVEDDSDVDGTTDRGDGAAGRDDANPDASELDDPGPDDVIVLPWWQHPLNIVTIVVTMALVAGAIGWMIGDAGAEPGADASEVDIGFLQDMREHHEQAVGMGFIYLDLPDTDPGLRTVARTIVFGQGIEIGRMIQMLRDRGADEANLGDTSMTWMGMSAAPGSMPGMASPEDLDELSAASGETADRLFVELMTVHHLGGIEMAEYAVENGSDGEVRRLAGAMVETQQSDIAEMVQLLGT